MKLRPYNPETDFDILREWITDSRMHALWCAHRFTYPLSRDNFEEVLHRNGDSPFVAVDDDGRPTGFFCYAHRPEKKEGLLKFVVVDPARRGQGLGKAMLQLAVKYAFKTCKADAVYLRVFTVNTCAVRCYEHAGFTVEKTEPNALSYQDESWDCSSMAIRRPNRDKSMIRYTERITPEEYMELRKKVGWMEFPMEEAKACVENANMVICVRDDEKAIGVVRLLWDGGYVAFLSDLVVDPEYQGRGIGRVLVETVIRRIREKMKPGYKVKLTLNSAKGKEPFYMKFGFRERPNEDAGAAMDQWLTLEG